LGLGESKKEKIFSVKKRKEEETKNRSLGLRSSPSAWPREMRDEE
jgi:hypothetical protein